MNSKLCIFLLGTAVLLSCISNIQSAAIFAVPPPSVVTAHSSQVVARNYNGFAAAAVAAPLVAAAPAVAAPLAAAPVAAPLAAYHVAYDGTYLI